MVRLIDVLCAFVKTFRMIRGSVLAVLFLINVVDPCDRGLDYVEGLPGLYAMGDQSARGWRFCFG